MSTFSGETSAVGRAEDREQAPDVPFIIAIQRHGKTNTAEEAGEDKKRALKDQGITQVAEGAQKFLAQVPSLQGKEIYLTRVASWRHRTHETAAVAGDVALGTGFKPGDEGAFRARMQESVEQGDSFSTDVVDLLGIEPGSAGHYGLVAEQIYEGKRDANGVEIPEEKRDKNSAGPLMAWWIEKSDQFAVEQGEMRAETYTTTAGRLAELMLYYLKRKDQWSKALEDTGKDLTKSAVVKMIATHGSVGESFLLKLAEIQGGAGARDKVLETMGGATGMFKNGEGFTVEVTGPEGAVVRWRENTWNVTQDQLAQMQSDGEALRQQIAAQNKNLSE